MEQNGAARNTICRCSGRNSGAMMMAIIRSISGHSKAVRRIRQAWGLSQVAGLVRPGVCHLLWRMRSDAAGDDVPWGDNRAAAHIPDRLVVRLSNHVPAQL